MTFSSVEGTTMVSNINEEERLELLEGNEFLEELESEKEFGDDLDFSAGIFTRETGTFSLHLGQYIPQYSSELFIPRRRLFLLYCSLLYYH